MATQSIQQLHETLTADLKRLGSPAVVNDMLRKTFSARINGAIYEFAHKQSDPAYWSGVKHYGSGPSNRLRLPRTASEPQTSPATVKPKKLRPKKQAA